jgi:hypothetical protein
MPHFIKTLKYQSTVKPKVGIVKVPDPRHMTGPKRSKPNGQNTAFLQSFVLVSLWKIGANCTYQQINASKGHR